MTASIFPLMIEKIDQSIISFECGCGTIVLCEIVPLVLPSLYGTVPKETDECDGTILLMFSLISDQRSLQSSLQLVNVLYRTRRVHLVQQKVSLHLSSTDFTMRCQGTFGETLSFTHRLLRVEPLEHLRELPVVAVSDVLLQIHTAWSDERRV